jgi:hypothetical protein
MLDTLNRKREIENALKRENDLKASDHAAP